MFSSYENQGQSLQGHYCTEPDKLNNALLSFLFMLGDKKAHKNVLPRSCDFMEYENLYVTIAKYLFSKL